MLPRSAPCGRRAAPALELGRALDQAAQLLARKLCAGYEVPRAVHKRILRAARVTELTVLSWNLFHGRDAPPDPALQRAAWRLSGTPLDNGDLPPGEPARSTEQFAELIAGAAVVGLPAPGGAARVGTDAGRRCERRGVPNAHVAQPARACSRG